MDPFTGQIMVNFPNNVIVFLKSTKDPQIRGELRYGREMYIDFAKEYLKDSKEKDWIYSVIPNSIIPKHDLDEDFTKFAMKKQHAEVGPSVIFDWDDSDEVLAKEFLS